MLTVLAGLAQFERDLIRAREGRIRAIARGVRFGRPQSTADTEALRVARSWPFCVIMKGIRGYRFRAQTGSDLLKLRST
jgi:hypothetical protein